MNIDPLQAVPGSEFSWSVSRHDTFSSCKRRYWFQYYGVRVDDEIAHLKGLSALPLWTGNLVHDTIETYLKRYDTIVSEEEQAKLIRQITHGQMPQDWAYSQAGTKKFRLFEHEYNIKVTEWEKKVALGIVITCLRNFFKSDILKEIMEVGKKNWLSVEDLDTFEVSGTNAYVKMDMAYRRPNGKVRIVDWKTGQRVGKFNTVQLAGYALYAFKKGWASSPDEIETTLAYLAIPEYKEAKVDLNVLAEAQAFIETSASEMKAKLVPGTPNSARMEDFDLCGKEWTCRRCPFRRVCWPAFDSVRFSRGRNE